MKKVICFISLAFATCLSSTAIAEVYHIRQIYKSPDARQWCAKTDAPAGHVLMDVGAGKKRVIYGSYSLENSNKGSSFCSDYFKPSKGANDKIPIHNRFPIKLIYDSGTQTVAEVTLNGIE